MEVEVGWTRAICVVDLGRVIAAWLSPTATDKFVHVASNTIHDHRVTDPNDHSSSPPV